MDNEKDAKNQRPLRRRWLRPLKWAGRIVVALVLMITALVAILYIPGVLNTIASRVLPAVEESTGMHIQVDDIRLRWPLRLSLERALITQRGDTMLMAREARVSVNPLALWRGRISVADAEIRNGFYRMGGPDSLYIAVNIDSIGAAASLNLQFDDIDVDHADLNGARVRLLMGPDSTATPVDTTPTSPMHIAVGPVTLRNVAYTMSMALTDDTIAACLNNAALTRGELLIADTIDIRADRLTLAVDSALYGRRGATPLAGLDLDWLTLRDASARVDSFAMHGANLSVPLRSLRVGEVAGMPFQGSGLFEMTESALYARGFKILLNNRTNLALDAEMGLADPSSAPLRLDAAAEVFTPAVAKAFPVYAPLLAPLPDDTPLTLRAVASGTMASLRIDTLAAAMSGIFSLRGSGTAANLSDPKLLDADITLDGRLVNAAPFRSMLPSGVKLPPLTLRAVASARGNNYAARLTAATAAGRLALDARMGGAAPRYSVRLRADSFPVAAFMPSLGIGAVSGDVKAVGLYFNPLRRGATLDASVGLRNLVLGKEHIGGINLDAKLKNSNLDANLRSSIPDADLAMILNARLEPKNVSWDLDSRINNLDLKALGLTDSILGGSLTLDSRGYAALNFDTIQADATLRNANLRFNSSRLKLDSLSLHADAGRQTILHLGNRTIRLDFRADTALMPLTRGFADAAVAVDSMIARRNFLADSLVSLLPPFALRADLLPGNEVAGFLAPSGISFNTLTFTAGADTTLRAHADILGFSSGETLKIDTISAELLTRNDTLLMDIDMNNRPGTLDEFAHVCLKGHFKGHEGKFFLQQQNLRGETGYRLGFLANVSDSIAGIKLTPTKPTIAYKNWVINDDNYLAINPHTFKIYANIDARGDDSRIRILTSRHVDSDSIEAPNELTVQISDIHIQDWLQINPFAPPVAGDVNADLTVNYSTKSVSGYGTVGLKKLTYGRKPVGDFDLDLDVSTDFGGAIWANAVLDVNGRRAMSASGALNDSTRRSPIDLNLKVSRFPLAVANPFLPKEYAALSGTLNGRMDVGGTFSALTLDGAINFRDAAVAVGMMGTSFRLDSTDIAVDSNLVRFNNFAIYGGNKNPLRVNGNINLKNFAAPTLALQLDAKNMQFLDSKKSRSVNLYGRGFLDLDADVTGSLTFLRVNANLAILPQTNLTYQITDAKAVVGMLPDDNVVKFVNFADTAQVAMADTIDNTAMQMILSANLDIRQGSLFTVDLSTDGQNRAQLKPQGILNYSMSPSQPDGRLTGRLIIDGGFFRYSLPVISEKNFSFTPGSYVAFNGPILNPTLHISASDQVKANVTRAGENSRLVNFDVILSASGTPERLDVAFDLSTNDDLSLQNELQSMSPTQRANQAMNLLLYGIYSSGGTSATANLSGNALYGFLSSQLNKWAANTIKGVDLSFGFDQYDRTRNGQTSTATQYSYKVSKSLFNDRFKIVVGGNYSTDSDDSEIAENLISDVSFEYMLNQSGSMYVRLFRHTGYESILEGEVTQTGVGFVVKRRINRVADIFNFIKAAKQ